MDGLPPPIPIGTAHLWDAALRLRFLAARVPSLTDRHRLNDLASDLAERAAGRELARLERLATRLRMPADEKDPAH